MRSALIVTSDAALRLVLVRLFGRHGWCVDAPACDHRTLAFLAEDPRSLTLVDWQTTSVSASMFLTAIRTHPIWHAARVMVICCGSEPEDAKWAVELGANDILEKPFRLNELMDKIEPLRPTLEGIAFNPNIRIQGIDPTTPLP
jgi:DNA-binding response OmpR family regulator